MGIKIKTEKYIYKHRTIKDVWWFGFTAFVTAYGLVIFLDGIEEGNWFKIIWFGLFTALNIWLLVHDYRALKKRLAESYVDDLDPQIRMGMRLRVVRGPKV